MTTIAPDNIQPIVQNGSQLRVIQTYWPNSDSWVAAASSTNTFLAHTGMLQATYGHFAPTAPLAVAWVQLSQTSGTGATSRNILDEAALAQYQALGDRLSDVALMADPPVEKGAITSADEVLKALVHFNFQPPQLSWHGGDAIVMLWKLGQTSYALTVTDGEIGFVVRAEQKLLRKKDSIPLSDVRYLVGN
jgi:hypothetical protein